MHHTKLWYHIIHAIIKKVSIRCRQRVVISASNWMMLPSIPCCYLVEKMFLWKVDDSGLLKWCPFWEEHYNIRKKEKQNPRTKGEILKTWGTPPSKQTKLKEGTRYSIKVLVDFFWRKIWRILEVNISVSNSPRTWFAYPVPFYFCLPYWWWKLGLWCSILSSESRFRVADAFEYGYPFWLLGVNFEGAGKPTTYDIELARGFYTPRLEDSMLTMFSKYW